MKKSLFVIITFGIAASIFFLIQMKSNDQVPISKTKTDHKDYDTKRKPKNKIGICYSWFGPSDQSMNSLIYNGAILIKTKFQADVVYITPAEQTAKEYEKAIRHLIEKEQANLIIAPSFLYRRAIDNIAHQYPDTQFVVLDVLSKNMENTNVTSVIFAQHEGSFVVGALAAKMTLTKNIGFIGGADVDVIKAFLEGFREGIEYVNPNVNLHVEYVSFKPDYSGFASPEKGLKIANSLYQKGIDIIYSVAGGTGNGIIQSAKENKKFVIGVDSNQDHMAPGYVLTSMMKRWDRSIAFIYQKYMSNQLTGTRVFELDYKTGGVGLTDFEFTKDKVPENILVEILDIEKEIASGSIVVSDYLKNPQKKK
jgi:basic membrane protein A and related proteins